MIMQEWKTTPDGNMMMQLYAGWYIVYISACNKTAIVYLPQGEVKVLRYVLAGDHRQAYEKLIVQGLGDCLKYYDYNGRKFYSFLSSTRRYLLPQLYLNQQ